MRSARGTLVLLLALGACGGEPPGYDAPACALFDADTDECLVSNVHGEPWAKDDNGYIARVRADGRMHRRWIQGGHNGVTLHAPSGMALVGELLWVADIDVLRVFDRRSGAPRGEVAVPGATSLHGLAAAPDGTIYCSDAGLDAGSRASGSDAIWQLPGGSFPPASPPKVLIRGVGLGHPRGLVARQHSVYVVNGRDGQFFSVDQKGRRTDLATAPAAGLDGLVRVEQADGRAVWYATSQVGRCVYRFDAGGGCVPLPGTFERPAGLGHDSKRGELLVPLTGANRLERVRG